LQFKKLYFSVLLYNTY